MEITQQLKVSYRWDISLGADTYVDDKNVKDVTAGDDVTINEKIENANEVTFGEDSYVANQMQDDVSLGTTVSGKLENI